MSDLVWPPDADDPSLPASAPLPSSVLERARRQALEALSDAGRYGAARRLVDYYAIDGDYAGASFATLGPVEPNDVTAVDLHATRLLSVPLGPGATRRLLAASPERAEALRRLASIEADDLATADSATLGAMAHFYRWVKEQLASPAAQDPNPWVTASKLCARKRPSLFPVRDREVCRHLGVLDLNDFRRDWLVFRELLRDPEVTARLAELPGEVREAAAGRDVVLDESRLRLLDAALWTRATSRALSSG
jgi:hypothetical protein